MALTLSDLAQFNAGVMRQTPPKVPTMPDISTILTSLALIDEERAELSKGLAANDLVEVADALGDLIVVIYQLAFFSGIPIDEVLSEIHRSNMSKTGGMFNEAGKFVKPESYSRADIKSILEKHGWRRS